MANRLPTKRFTPLAVYVVLAFVVVGVLLAYQLNTNRRFDDTDRRTCDLVSFTRATQREVIRFLQQTSALLATTSRTPEVRTYFGEQLPHLNELRNRTEPPACRR